MIFIYMKQLIKQILTEETEKRSKDLFEIIIQQDIINSDTRRIDRKAIDQLVSKLVSIIKKCTNDKTGEFLYQVRNIRHSIFTTDVVYHRLIFISNELERYLPCIKDKTQRSVWMNHDKGEIILRENLTNIEIKTILKDIPKNSTHRNSWTKDEFFEFYHPEMLELTIKPFVRINIDP